MRHKSFLLFLLSVALIASPPPGYGKKPSKKPVKTEPSAKVGEAIVQGIPAGFALWTKEVDELIYANDLPGLRKLLKHSSTSSAFAGPDALIYAAGHQQIEALKLLGSSLVTSGKDATGDTPLMAAARSGDIKTIRVILDKGFSGDIFAVDRGYSTAIAQGLARQQRAGVALLYEALRHDKRLEDYLAFAAMLPMVREVAARSITGGYDPAPVQTVAPVVIGTTSSDDPESLDASSSEKAWVAALDKAVDRMNKSNSDKDADEVLSLENALIYPTLGAELKDAIGDDDVVKEGRIEKINALFAQKVDVNAFVEDNPALGNAAMQNNQQITQLLLDHGADAFLVDAGLQTAVDDAVELKKPENAKLILQHLRKTGTLDTFLAWEDMLAKARAIGSSDSDEFGLTAQRKQAEAIRALAAQLPAD